VIRPGEALNHRFVYSLCPARGSQRLPVQLRTTIRRGSDRIVSEVVPGFALKAGQWTVDAKIEVPPAAPAGFYNIETNLIGVVSASRRAHFQID
jgi:hypothetical protein